MVLPIAHLQWWQISHNFILCFNLLNKITQVGYCVCTELGQNHDKAEHCRIILIVITFYSPSCLGQETAKGPFGLRVKLPPGHLSTTHGGGFTLSLLMLNVKQGRCEYQFL